MTDKIASLEPEMEALFQKLVPEYKSQVKGATEEQIAKIEEIAGQPLPRFYRWFLMRMGADMGPFEYESIDFTAESIINAYEECLIDSNPDMLLIGYDSDDIMPNHHFYNLKYPVRDDFLVMSGGDMLIESFETLREMFAYNNLVDLKINNLPQKCEGFFTDNVDCDVFLKLHSVMPELGFVSPLPTGYSCMLYDRVDAVLAITDFATGNHKHKDVYFTFGGSDEKAIRCLLEQIADKARLILEIDEWEPFVK